MREKTLKKFSLVISVAGLVLLYLVSTQLSSQRTDIRDVTIEDLGAGVKVCGKIDSKRVSNNHIFFTLKDDTGSIRFIIFNTTAINLRESGVDAYNFSAGTEICANGVVNEYPKGSGQLEIIYRGGAIERL